MRNRCEASGHPVRPSEDRRHGTCPLCERVFALTAAGRLFNHSRHRARELGPEEIERRLERAAREAGR